MRGEHRICMSLPRLLLGSSPHARGALVLAPPLRGAAGIIPACAGSTRHVRLQAQRPRDHPRMRGEHVWYQRGTPSSQGSSPHARGALNQKVLDSLGLGIIPACAGSTPTARKRSCDGRDHPRMRGEHVSPARAISAWRGSSPHARGAQDSRGFTASQSGIIPACAGSTAEGGRAQRHHEDHPRMRGEHSRVRLPVTETLGSSPHARGARTEPDGDCLGAGIIPACAGSTGRRRRTPRRWGDHPRMRGEHSARRTIASS